MARLVGGKTQIFNIYDQTAFGETMLPFILPPVLSYHDHSAFTCFHLRQWDPPKGGEWSVTCLSDRHRDWDGPHDSIVPGMPT